MSTAKSFSLNLYKKYSFLKPIYLFYNIYIRNLKYYFNSSQFGEERKIINHFEENYKGRYVDVGCYHPTKVNNTFEMYKRGWSGINIDLNPLSIELFNFVRPRDINICSAISKNNSTKNLYFHNDLSPLNTIDKNHVNFLKKEFSIKKLKIKKIKSKKITNILEKYKYFKIDFLNIDIEGHELEVLKTIDFRKFNIKIICVEILTHNNLSKTRKREIFKFLKKKGYVFIGKNVVNYIFKKKNS